MDINSVVGKNIKLLRETQDITQKQLGDSVNISKQQLSKVENGNGITIERLEKVASYFNRDVNFFIRPHKVSITIDDDNKVSQDTSIKQEKIKDDKAKLKEKKCFECAMAKDFECEYYDKKVPDTPLCNLCFTQEWWAKKDSIRDKLKMIQEDDKPKRKKAPNVKRMNWSKNQ